MTSIPATSGIYKITCTVTGKLYLGSTVNLHKRCKDHFSYLRRNAHRNSKLQRAFNKYGEQSFIFEVLELVLPPFLLEREQYWLDKLKPFSKGYNIALSSQSAHLGLKHTQASIDKMSANAASRGKPAYNRGQKPSLEAIKKNRQAYLGRPGPMVGKRHSLATIEKLRGNKNALGRKLSSESCTKISQGRMGNKVLVAIAPDSTEYVVQTIREFCRDHNLNSSSLIRVAKGKRRSTQGWTARYVDRD